MKLVLAWIMSLIAGLLLNSCGGGNETESVNRQIENPAASPDQSTGTPLMDPNLVILSSHLSFGPNQEMSIPLPANYSGFCTEQMVNGEAMSNATWALNPPDVQGLLLTRANRCVAKLKRLPSYDENSNAVLTARLPLADPQKLQYDIRIHSRLAPAVAIPTAPIDLHLNQESYTGSASATPPYSGGPNYNDSGLKMRFCSATDSSNKVFRWFRDGDQLSNRHFGFQVKWVDPSPFNASIDDFVVTTFCTPVDQSLFTSSAGCSNFCPFESQFVTINAKRYVRFQFAGAVQTMMQSNQNSIDRFVLDNGQCLSADHSATQVDLKLKIVSASGTLTTVAPIAKMNLEVDPCPP